MIKYVTSGADKIAELQALACPPSLPGSLRAPCTLDDCLARTSAAGLTLCGEIKGSLDSWRAVSRSSSRVEGCENSQAGVEQD